MRRLSLFLLFFGLFLFILPVHAQAPSLTITAPKADECIAANTKYTIKWTSSTPGPDHIAIAFREDGTPAPSYALDQTDYFADDLPNTGSYVWTTPSDKTTGRITLEGHTETHTQFALASSPLITFDTTPPSTPVLTLKEKTESAATLEWLPVTDTGCAELTGYRLFQGTTLIATLDKTATQYQISKLSPDAAYTFKLVAYDAATSTDSAPLTVRTAIDPNATPETSPEPTPSMTPSPLPTPTAPLTLPAISKIKVQETTASSTTITFESDKAVRSAIDYGPTLKYGKTLREVTEETDGTTWRYTTTLKDLTSNTAYHFRIRAIENNPDADEVKSADYSFQTKLSKEDEAVSVATVTNLSIGDQTLSSTPTAPAKVIEREDISLSGTAQPNTKLIITVHSKVRTFEATANADGKWTLTIPTQGLEEGAHEVSIAVAGTTGKTSKSKSILRFELVPRAHAAPLSFKVENGSRASQFGQVYGTSFLIIATIGTVYFSYRLARHSRKSKDPYVIVSYHETTLN